MNEDPRPRILMVDDDQLFVDIVARRFERESLSLEHVESAEDALKLLEEGMEPDLILLDIQLPGMDGFVFLEKIRSMPALSKLPVIVLSNFSEPEDLERTKNLGVLRHVQKVTLEPAEVVTMVRETLQA